MPFAGQQVWTDIREVFGQERAVPRGDHPILGPLPDHNRALNIGECNDTLSGLQRCGQAALLSGSGESTVVRQSLAASPSNTRSATSMAPRAFGTPAYTAE